jgi:hypothetical protein
MTDSRRRNRTRRSSGMSEQSIEARQYLLGERTSCWWALLTEETVAQLKRLWESIREEVLADWTSEKPGTRPPGWWEFDSPGPRQRVGGTGNTQAAARGVSDVYACGMPLYWIDDTYAKHYPGAVAVDATDPPRFEAEATYLKRLGLLAPGELKLLTPADFEPEAAITDSRQGHWLPPSPPRPPRTLQSVVRD